MSFGVTTGSHWYYAERVPCEKCGVVPAEHTKGLMICKVCRKGWHGYCHEPPVGADIRYRMTKADEKHPTGSDPDKGLASWACFQCQAVEKARIQRQTEEQELAARQAKEAEEAAERAKQEAKAAHELAQVEQEMKQLEEEAKSMETTLHPLAQRPAPPKRSIGVGIMGFFGYGKSSKTDPPPVPAAGPQDASQDVEMAETPLVAEPTPLDFSDFPYHALPVHVQATRIAPPSPLAAPSTQYKVMFKAKVLASLEFRRVGPKARRKQLQPVKGRAKTKGSVVVRPRAKA